MTTSREITVVLQANEPEYLNISGNFVNIRSVTGSVRVGLNGSGLVSYVQSETINGAFDRLELVSSTTQAVTLLYGPGRFDGIAAIIDNDVSLGVPSALAATAPVSCPNGAVTLVSASGATKKTTRLSTLSSAAGNVFFGPSGIGAGEGCPIEPGGIDYVPGTMAIYVRNDSGAGVDVYVGEFTEV